LYEAANGSTGQRKTTHLMAERQRESETPHTNYLPFEQLKLKVSTYKVSHKKESYPYIPAAENQKL
jgi:hypothetical protein